MSEDTGNVSKGRLWGGRVVSALPVLALVASAIAKLTHAPKLVEQFSGKFGYPETLMTPLGVIELLCAIVYAVPQTSVLGAVLLTGYFGGAVATHVRVADNFASPLVLGVLVWVGLYLRDPRLGALVPVRKPTSG